LDELAGLPACQGVTERYLEGGSRLPDLSALYEELGITLDEMGARFVPAPLAWVRDAIAPLAATPALHGGVSGAVSN
jgi:hypothetical protein